MRKATLRLVRPHTAEQSRELEYTRPIFRHKQQNSAVSVKWDQNISTLLCNESTTAWKCPFKLRTQFSKDAVNQSINQQLTCNKDSFPNKSYRLDIARPLHRNSTEQITRGISWRNRESSWFLLFYLFIQWRRLSAHDPLERIKYKKVFWLYHVWRISTYSISENCVVFVRFNGNKAEAGYVAC